MTRSKHVRPWDREHNPHCWMQHEDCALRAAADLMEARRAHAQSRRDLFRVAVQPNYITRRDTIELARRVLTENHELTWKREEALP